MTDPELWQPGEEHVIPRLYGDGYPCIITAVTPIEVRFIGPTGLGSITRELLKELS